MFGLSGKGFIVLVVAIVVVVCISFLDLSCQGAEPTATKAPVFTGRRPSSVPDEANWYRDIEFARAGDKKLTLDLYIPKTGSGPWPVVVWIHGGGWMEGDKFPAPAAWLSAHGYAVASVSYRLSTEANFPAQIHDCMAAVRWLRGNAEIYNLDSDKIAAFGESAGGHLAALMGVGGGNKYLEGDLGDYTSRSSSVAAVCNCFGPVDLTPESEGDLKALGMQAQISSKYVIKQLLGPMSLNMEAKARKASVKTYIDSDDPPFLIIHGDKDPIVPVNQSRRLHSQLAAAGVESELIIMKNGGHMFFHDKSVRKRIEQFFDKVLKAKD